MGFGTSTALMMGMDQISCLIGRGFWNLQQGWALKYIISTWICDWPALAAYPTTFNHTQLDGKRTKSTIFRNALLVGGVRCEAVCDTKVENRNRRRTEMSTSSEARGGEGGGARIDDLQLFQLGIWGTDKEITGPACEYSMMETETLPSLGLPALWEPFTLYLYIHDRSASIAAHLRE